ncbi:hypothetical protein [Methanobrevibacter sp. DSM 116169]|uniref:hypothetical protein n=1 Tax=Methanobrevibacter sp. DSM 116169 TaxID=3242727 RepID=UPI0038FC7295
MKIKSKWAYDKEKVINYNGKDIYGVSENLKDQKAFVEEYGILKEDLTLKEQYFLEMYTQDGHVHINTYLRTLKDKKLQENHWNNLADNYFKKRV